MCNCARMRKHDLDEESVYFEIYDLFVFVTFDACGSSTDDYCIDIFEKRENEEIAEARQIHLRYDELKRLISELDTISVEMTNDRRLHTEGGNICLEWCSVQGKFRIVTATGSLHMFKHESDELIDKFRFEIPRMMEERRGQRCQVE